MNRRSLAWVQKNGVVIVVAVSILVIAALLLRFEGRLWLCACGFMKLWHGQVNSSGNSQHLFDPYSFSHVIHGMLIYALLWLIGRKIPAPYRLLIALALEAGWEILENSSFIINRYRSATVSFDYFGDSIINSIGDIFSMAFGFFLAFRLKLWQTVCCAVCIEIILLGWIHDNLTINIIMLIHPIEAIKQWQYVAGAPSN